jgi:cytochrome c oxidase subunit 2
MWLRFLTGASTYSGTIDHMIFLIAGIVGFWFFIAEGALFYFTFRYLRKDGQRTSYITGENSKRMLWVTIPVFLIVLCDIGLNIADTVVWIHIKQDLPPAERTVRVIGQQWSWTFQDPGPDGVLDTADDIQTVDDLHVLVDTTYHFEVMSRDVVHSFAIPAFRLKQDTIPGRTITGWFRATRTGTFDIQCTQMCGLAHGMMGGHIIVETPRQHNAWMQQAAAGGGSLARQNATPASSAPATQQLAEARP